MTIPVGNTPPNINDTTIGWAKAHAVDGLVKPSLVFRMVTDSNWIFHHTAQMDGYYSADYDNATLTNCGLPGMRLPGITNWSVTENIDNVVQTARVEVIDALPVSQVTTTLTNTLLQRYHSSSVSHHWVKAPDGQTVSLDGSFALDSYSTTSGGYLYTYQEDRLLFREFLPETASTTGLAYFPNPRVPTDEDDANSYWTSDANGVGSYFILIDDEVIRVHDVSDATFYIAAGGRGINGVIQQHDPGATIHLLGYGPYTGKWAGFGYLSLNESKPYKSLVRPGTCFASYEGYGDLPSALTKDAWSVSSGRNYEFTGYWFVKNQESTLSEDGIPHLALDLASAGYILQHQKITPNIVYRFRNQLANWAESAFDQAGIPREIPGDWVDYHTWEPDRPNSYPLAIKTEFAQHKQFFDHMADTENGRNCEFCQQEWVEYINRPGYTVGQNPAGEARAVGRHIYKESIRVYTGGGPFEAGPLLTYARLPIRLALAAWETPIDGNPLAQRWTKIPMELWDNMANISTGRCWNGQLSFQFQGETPNYPWASLLGIAEDHAAYYHKDRLMCPFESSYDKQDWFQPLQDMAELNRMTFQFNRRGYPIFIPRGLNLRGISWAGFYDGSENRGEWFMGWGGSITNYNYSFDADAVLTMVWVSGTDAFEQEFSVVAAGTGYDINGNLLWYSSKIGNREALQITGGAQQVDTLALDNLVLGLDWDTNLASWSLRVDRTSAGEGITEISRLPPIPEGTVGKNQHNFESSVKNLKRLWNFLVLRKYILEVTDPNDNSRVASSPVAINDTVDDEETELINEMQRFFIAQGYRTGHSDGTWGPDDGDAAKTWARNEEDAIKKDIWWYALGGYDWEYYVSAITGLPVIQRKDASFSDDDPVWVTDQLAYRKSIADWQTQFFKQAINVGNKAIDDSIAKATVRNWSTNIADPRIQIGDVVYITIPGYLDANDAFGDLAPPYSPFRNATYITQITRTMDTQAGTYTAQYAGYRYRECRTADIGWPVDINLVTSNYYGTS